MPLEMTRQMMKRQSDTKLETHLLNSIPFRCTKNGIYCILKIEMPVRFFPDEVGHSLFLFPHPNSPCWLLALKVSRLGSTWLSAESIFEKLLATLARGRFALSPN